MFYCAVHGPQQLSEIVVAGHDDDVPSQATSPARPAARWSGCSSPCAGSTAMRATRTGSASRARRSRGPFAGLYSPRWTTPSSTSSSRSELRVKAGEPITWKMFGADHSISFGVPRYFPIIDVRRRRRPDQPQARRNPRAVRHEIPEQDGQGIFKIDGGTYSGSGSGRAAWSALSPTPSTRCASPSPAPTTTRVSSTRRWWARSSSPDRSGARIVPDSGTIRAPEPR